MDLLVALPDRLVAVDTHRGRIEPIGPSGIRPTCLVSDPVESDHAWFGTRASGVLRTTDGGATWNPAGLQDERVTALAVGTHARTIWAGTEPSAIWRRAAESDIWTETTPLVELPSSSAWAFPPRPDTHHVRWIAPHPTDADVLWVAVEAGALVRTQDGGATWSDRVAGGPRDTHELAVHPDAPDRLRVSAGDGYFESDDGGETWSRPMEGLEVGYLRSVAIDPGAPEVVLVSASSSARRAYSAGRSDGRVYRKEGDGAWQRVRDGWPDTPSTIAPLLLPGRSAGELWAADERGVHHSADGGRRWSPVAEFTETPDHLRGVALAQRQRA